MVITREQRVALKQVYDRCTVYDVPNNGSTPLTYRQFRKHVVPTVGCDGAVAVFWCAMWLCIERDGYCHS